MKLYLDTSIPCAYFDYSKPVRQLITQKWFEHEAGLYELYISVITIEEIEQFSNVNKRKNIKDLTLDYNMNILELSQEALDLAFSIQGKNANIIVSKNGGEIMPIISE